MDQDSAPARRRRLTAQGMMLRRKRIFARLREGLSYDEIAGKEGLSAARVRQIVYEVLQKRAIDNGADHAKLQLDRLTPAMQLAAEGIAAGLISAINPYLKVLDRLDRYQTVAGAHEGYDAEARKKLLDKINRLAANLGFDEVIPAEAPEQLNKIGAIVADDPGDGEPRPMQEPSPEEDKKSDLNRPQAFERARFRKTKERKRKPFGWRRSSLGFRKFPFFERGRAPRFKRKRKSRSPLRGLPRSRLAAQGRRGRVSGFASGSDQAPRSGWQSKDGPGRFALVRRCKPALRSGKCDSTDEGKLFLERRRYGVSAPRQPVGVPG